jgi:hypothetical protein
MLLMIVLIAVVVVVALVVFFLYRRRQQQQQQEQLEQARQDYGPEFERLAQERGSEREAEQELRERRERIESETKTLSQESRERYDEQWRQVEQTFVDDPKASLDDADRVVAEMLAERNFPTDSRQEASEGIGAVHPGVVEDFKEAQQVRQESVTDSGGEADLDKMRQAIQKYRSVYQQLRED